jgi:uncharacterized protein (DUF433 family)
VLVLTRSGQIYEDCPYDRDNFRDSHLTRLGRLAINCRSLPEMEVAPRLGSGATMIGKPMTPLTRITLDPEVMGGKPCIRGLRITVGTIVGLVASGRSIPEILAAYPYLEEADVREALVYAAWRVEETEVPLGR